jgi:hypothetical protein
MKILKIITILSFLFIIGLQENGYPILFMLILYAYQFLHDLFTFNFLGNSWLMGISLPIIGIIILYKRFADRSFFIYLLCFIIFVAAVIYFTGIFERVNWQRVSFWFLIPSFTFIISSILLLVKSYKIYKKEQKSKILQ